jgi:ketosteroid isomerase-like protein
MRSVITSAARLTRDALLILVVTSIPHHVVAEGNQAAELVAIEKAMATAVVEMDFESLDKVYADDFVFSHSTGVVETKDDWFTFLRDNKNFYTFRSVDAVNVELHGNLAVTDGRIHIKTRSDDPKRKEFTVWYIRIFERRDGDWQLVSHRSIRDKTGPLED